MMQAKPAAALASDLLARKGEAVPTSLVVLPMVPRAPTGEIKPELSVPRDGARGGKPLRGGAVAPAAKLSLRLDGDRHRRLRVAALHLGRSGQQILVEALDAYLERSAEAILGGQCACLRRNSP
jgi:hypothetical protein